MIYSTTNNSITKEDPTVPGVVLAVSPNDSQLLINDQARHIFYIYNTSGSIAATFGGMGNAAAWTPDATTLYVADNANLNSPTTPPASGGTCPANPLISEHTDTLYVYNPNSGWSNYSLPSSPLAPAATPTCTTQPNTAFSATEQTPAITNPGVGAYLARSTTVAHTWCPTGTAGSASTPANITAYYPLGDSLTGTATDTLAATTDGKHILGATLSSGDISFSDIGVTIPSQEVTNADGVNIALPLPCTQTANTLNALTIKHTLNSVVIPAGSLNSDGQTQALTSVNQVVSSPPPTLQNGNSTSQAPSFAFITYSGTTPGAKLPYYIPSTTAGDLGTVSYVTLTGTAVTAPVVGAFSPDNTLFFVSTSGDNKIHYISIPATPTGVPTDTKQFSPNLPACVPQSASDPYCTNPVGTNPNSFVPATAITVKPRTTT
jgi:trimeric autotransporter adhesin